MAIFDLTVRADTTQFNIDIGNLISQVEKQKATINVDFKVSTAQLDKIKTLAMAVSTAYSTGTSSPAAKSMSTRSINSQTRALQRYIEALTQTKEAEKTTGITNPNLTKNTTYSKDAKQYYSTITQIDRLLTRINNNQQKWTAAKKGKSSGAYSSLGIYATQLDQIKAQATLEGKISDETIKDVASIQSGVISAEGSIKSANEATLSWGDRITSLASKFSTWLTISQTVMAGVRAIKAMTDNVTQLDTAMVSLKKVTDAPETEFQAYFERSRKTAIEYATTMKDIINSTADFSRLGFTFEESESLAKVASVYNEVGDINDIDEASQSIISTMKAFKVETKDAMSIVDKFNEVGNNFAISSEGIGQAFARSASSMAAANNTIDETVALITAGNTVVQDADQVGTGFKTISMRIRGAKTDLTSAGLDTDGMVESVAKLREEIVALSGVDIMLDNNTFKSTYQIMDELSQKWGELTDIQQASITELIAGKRQGNLVSSIMENFDIARKALDTSLNSSGSATKEFEIQLDSVEAKSKQFKAAFESLSSTTINSDFLKGAIDGGTTLIQILDKITGFFGTGSLVGGGIGAFFAKQKGWDFARYDYADGWSSPIWNSFKNRGKAPTIDQTTRSALAAMDEYPNLDLTTYIESGEELGKVFGSTNATYVQFLDDFKQGNRTLKQGETYTQSFIKSLKGVSVGQKALSVGISALSSIGWTMGISLAITGISKLVDNIVNAGEKAKEASEKINHSFKTSTDEIKNNRTTLEGLSDEYDKLSKGVDEQGKNISLTSDEYKKYQDIVSTVGEISPSLVAQYGEENVLLTKKNDLIKEAIKLQNDQYRNELRDIISLENMSTVFKGYAAEYTEAYKKLDTSEATSESQALARKLSELYAVFGNGSFGGKYGDVAKHIAKQVGMENVEDEIQKYINKNSKFDWGSLSQFIAENADIISQNIDSIAGSLSPDKLGMSETLFSRYAEEADDIAQNYIKAEREISNINSKVSSQLKHIAEYNESYDGLNDSAKSVVDSLINQYDIEDITKKDIWGKLVPDEDAIANIRTQINKVINAITPEIQTALADLFEIDTSKVSATDFGKKVDEVLSNVVNSLGLNGEQKKQLMISLGFEIQDDNIVTVQDMLNKVKGAIKDKDSFNGKIDLSFDDLQTAYSLIESMENLEIGGIDSYDELVSKIQEINELTAQMGDSMSKADKISLATKITEYNALSQSIKECTDSSKMLELINKQKSLGAEIAEVTKLASSYTSLSTAYKAWTDAQGTENPGDKYKNFTEGLDSVKEMYVNGEIGIDDFQEAVQFMTNQDLSNATPVEYMRTYEQSAPKIRKFFTDGQEGCKNFVSELDKLNEGFVEFNEETQTWSINGSQTDIADKLGISEAAVEAILGRMRDYGWNVTIEADYQSLVDLQGAAETANTTLQELQDKGEIDLSIEVPEFDFSATDKELDDQIKSAQTIFDELAKSEDGSIDLSVSGAKEAKVILTSLIAQKQQLENPAPVQLSFTADTQGLSTLEQAALKVEEIRSKLQKLEIGKATGENTIGLEKEIQSAITELNNLKLPDDLKMKLGFDDQGFKDAVSKITDQEITLSAGLDETSLSTITSALNKTAENGGKIWFEVGIDENKLLSYKPDNKDAEVKYEPDFEECEKAKAPELDGKVNYEGDFSQISDKDVPTKKGKIIYEDSKPSTTTNNSNKGTTKKNNGNNVITSLFPPFAIARGTAFSDGSWGASRNGFALGGELGQELVVRNGRYFTIGDNGAEFFRYQKGDIIFNAEQTRQIFEKGKIISGNRRGVALAEGNAFAFGGTGAFYKNGKQQSIYVTKTKENTEKKSDKKDKTQDINVNVNKVIDTTNMDVKLEDMHKLYEALPDDTPSSASTSLEETMEDALKEMQEQIDNKINDYEHQIFLNEKHNAPIAANVELYRQMQQSVNEQSNAYREKGLEENSEYIQKMQKQWWEYEEAIIEANAKIYEDIVDNSKNVISFSEILLENAVSDADYNKVKEYSANIISEYRTMQQAVHNQAEYYRSLGYSETSKELNELKESWWEYEKAIAEATKNGFQSLVDNASEALDDVQEVYSVLKNAAQEYADSGFISGDTYQEILSIGVEYLGLLKNSNGALEINERNIKKVIKAKTEQLGIETALNYIQSLSTALINNDEQALNNLLTATDNATRSTWGFVYAQLELLNLDDAQFKKAQERINIIRSLTDVSISGIGKATNELSDGLNQTSDALQSILDYTIEMIRQETENEIENLEEQISDYREIVTLQKESLETTKDQNDYNKDVTERLKDIAEIQNRINQLSLDDSREAQAEKKSLEEELADLQGELSETQSDYAYDKQVESLDKMADAYEEEKNEEIDILRDNISSQQKLYELALERIKDEGDDLLDQLISWNEEYGNVLNSTISEAWENACTALDKYNYKLDEAMKKTQESIDDSENQEHTSIGGYTSYYNEKIREKMKANSLKWYISSESEQRDLEKQNSNYASQLGLTPKNGSWYLGDTKFYSIGTWEAVDYITKAMFNNSKNWTEGRTDLESANVKMASYIQTLTGQKVWRDGNGVWWIDDNELFKSYGGIYHDGGIVGGKSTLKDNEVLSLLEKGEVVLDEAKKKNLYRILDDTHPLVASARQFAELFVPRVKNNFSNGVSELMIKDTAKVLSKIKADGKDGYKIDNLEVNVPIQVVERLDESDIKRYSKLIGQMSSEYIREGFTKSGIKSTTKLF